MCNLKLFCKNYCETEMVIFSDSEYAIYILLAVKTRLLLKKY